MYGQSQLQFAMLCEVVCLLTTCALSAQSFSEGAHAKPLFSAVRSVFDRRQLTTARPQRFKFAMTHDWRAATFFLLMLVGSVCASTEIPVCEAAKVDKLDSAEGLMDHCKNYCKDTSAVATSYGAPNVAVERQLVDSDLCQDGENIGKDVDCAEPYIDKIEFLFAYLEKETKVFSNVRNERKKLVSLATSIGTDYQFKFTKLMEDSTNLTTSILAQRSKDLSANFNKAFEEKTKPSRESLKQSIKKLSDAIRIKQEELVNLQRKLDSQLQNCTVMTNAKPVKQVCRQRQGQSESNFCCCRTNGLAIYNPGNSGGKCTLPGKRSDRFASVKIPNLYSSQRMHLIQLCLSQPKNSGDQGPSLSTAFRLQKPGIYLQCSFLVMFSLVVSF